MSVLMKSLWKQLAIRLMKRLTIPPGRQPKNFWSCAQKKAAKWLVTGYQKAISKFTRKVYAVVVRDHDPNNTRRQAIAAIVLLVTPLHAISGMIGLGSFPEAVINRPYAGNGWSVATGVSVDGSIVVGYASLGKADSGDQDHRAFRWTQSGAMTNLGIIPGYESSHAAAVSADGNVVVGFLRTSSLIGKLQAFRWTKSGGMIGLGFLPGDESSTATGISADGTVVVGRSILHDGQQRAFRWTQSGGMIALGFLPGGTMSYITGLSADGSAMVGYADSKIGEQAFRWTKSGGMVGLGDPPGYENSYAYGISADGSVIVGHAKNPEGKGLAFRWTKLGKWSSLGLLPGGSQSAATAVSTDGAVIVGDADNDLGQQAFRWTQSGGMVALGFLPPGGSFSHATGVSADGAAVIGYGNNGARISESAPPNLAHEAFRWTLETTPP